MRIRSVLIVRCVMSRYIDADAMKEWLDEYLSVFKKYDKSEVKGFVEHQPSIDIVRCKECKKRGTWKCPRCGSDDDDFCSYGVRKTNTAAEEKPTPIRDYMVYGERKESE